MGLYRDESGRLLELDDKFAEARGYEPSAPSEGYGGALTSAADAARAEDSSGAMAFGNRFASGISLGLTDVALGETLTPLERQRVLDEMDAHPYLSAAGEITGTMVGSLAMPGSAAARTPTGYLSSLATHGVEAGLEQGGIAGTAKALTAMGAEGAGQNAGQYFGHASLEDKEVTAEGLNGALGTGFAFGVAGGGAALGVTKGAMAARRLYSRVMDGSKAAKAAESAWSLAHEEALTADLATARAAEAKLDDIRKAKMEAMRYRNEARSITQDERIRAASAERPVAETDFEAGIPTNVVPREGAPAGQVTSVFKPEPTEVIPSQKLAAKAGPAGETRVAQTSSATPLEAQLAGTKAQLDEGAALKDVRPEPDFTGESGKTFAGREGEIQSRIKEMQRQGRTKESLAEMASQRQEALSEIRYKATEDLLGAQVAKREQQLMDVVEEFHAARKDVEQMMATGETPVINVYGVKGDAGMPVEQYDKIAGDIRSSGEQATKAGAGGNRKAVEILDDAHEEALLRAKHASEPSEAGKAITEAEGLERLLEGLAVPDVTPGLKGISREQMRTGRGEAAIEDMFPDIQKLQRYEKASAKLADELGSEAHPTSVLKAKALRDAERDSERKVFDRQARAIDDAEGPPYKTPKERVQHARGRQNEAQTKLDEIGVQEREARDAFGKANKKAREGERAKKAATRLDNKAAAKAGKFGAQDAGGLLEILDLPGLPKPSDLPIVGPLLGAYLKFRTLKKAMGRMAGRVPATADNRVAALASQTRDRIARAVDRSLGVVERGGKSAVRAAPAVAGILAHRIYDDGGEDPKKGAPITAHAAARMRELAAYVHTPNAIEIDVRRELRGVIDPDVIAAAEQHRRAIMEYLLKNTPKVPEQSLLNQIDWQPSPAESMAFARRLEAVSDPAGVFEKLAHEQAMLSLEAAEALRETYPKLFGQAQQRLLERAQENSLKVPMRTRVQMSLLFKVPLDASLDPVNLKITQSVYERKPSSPAYNPAVPGAAPLPAPTVQPSIANPTNLAEAYTPSIDRR